MKKITLLVFTLLVLLLTKNSTAQMPPAPIKSPQIDNMIGTWISEPYEMMGSKMVDEVTQRMILNGQFMEIDVKAKADNGFVYEAKGIFSPSADGSMTGQMYDIFGKGGTAYTGMMEGETLVFTGTNDMMSETRRITVNGNNMTQIVTMTMKDMTGKEMPQQKLTISYKKQ